MGRPVDNGPPGRDEFLVHLAIAIKDNEEMENIKLRRSANRKRAKAAGIELGDMDFTIKVFGWAPSEIAAFFSRKFAYLGFANIPLNTQFDLFAGQTPAPQGGKTDFRAIGLAAGLAGKDGTPPPQLKGDEQQQWISGWQEGQRAHIMAMERRSQAAAAVPPSEPPAGDQQKELVLKETDFAEATSLETCDLSKYTGDEDLGAYDRIVVTDPDETEEVVLKDVAAGIGLTDEEFEAKPEEIAAQSPRKAAKAKSEGATS